MARLAPLMRRTGQTCVHQRKILRSFISTLERGKGRKSLIEGGTDSFTLEKRAVRQKRKDRVAHYVLLSHRKGEGTSWTQEERTGGDRGRKRVDRQGEARLCTLGGPWRGERKT